MNDRIPLAPLQKLAWFNLIVFAVAAASYAITVPLMAWHFHGTLAAESLPSLGMFGLCGFWGFGNRICNLRKLDERESLINQRAIMAGFLLFWQVWVLSCVGVWALLVYVRHQEVVPVILLPIMAFAGGIICVVTRAIATLLQYKRSAIDDIV